MTTQQHEEAKTALQRLHSLGFDVHPQWAELTKRQEDYDRGTPSEWDLRYTFPEVAPTIGSHFVEGAGKPQELSPHVMWKGFHYTLTPGQRRWFRENTGMTPSATVTVSWTESWPGTRHPRSFKVESDAHVNPALRKHTITEFIIRGAGKFFADAQSFDNEDARPEVGSLREDRVALGYYYTLESIERWAVKDLSDVDVTKNVQVTLLSDDVIRFTCQSTDAEATVPRSEFFATVAEYRRLHPKGEGDYKGPRRRKATKSSATSLEDLMKELEGGCSV